MQGPRERIQCRTRGLDDFRSIGQRGWPPRRTEDLQNNAPSSLVVRGGVNPTGYACVLDVTSVGRGSPHGLGAHHVDESSRTIFDRHSKLAVDEKVPFKLHTNNPGSATPIAERSRKIQIQRAASHLRLWFAGK